MSSKFLFDSFAWMEYLNGAEKGKKIAEFLEGVESGETTIFTPILALAEISDKLHREGREVQSVFDFIKTNSIIVHITEDIAFTGGAVKNKLRSFSKNISLADALNFQASKSVNAVFVTGDPDFKDVKDGILML